MWNLWVAATVFAAATAACGIQVDFSDARFHCEVSADCPEGQICTGGYCALSDGIGGDDSEGSGDAGPGGPETDPEDDQPPDTEELVYRPVADAYVDSTAPGSNHGASEQLRVDGSPTVTSYVKFDRDALNNIDDRYQVESARLEIYALGAHEAGYEVSIVQPPGWNEGTITAQDAPAPGAFVGSSGSIASAGWTSVDIASVIPEGDFESFALTTDDDTALSLASREAGDSAARLVLVVDAP